jgi:hypothetical protein
VCELVLGSLSSRGVRHKRRSSWGTGEAHHEADWTGNGTAVRAPGASVYALIVRGSELPVATLGDFKQAFTNFHVSPMRFILSGTLLHDLSKIVGT